MSKVPAGWEVKLLGELFPKIVVGYVGNVNNYYCSSTTGVPFYRTLNIRNGFFRKNEVVYVTKEFHKANKKSQIFNQDILIARVGANLGMVCKVEGLETEANIANAIIIKATKSYNSDFYTAFLLSKEGRDQIFSGAAGGAQGVFNTKLAQKISVPVPPLPEQTKIAQILSTWDKAIATTEKLIGNSQQQKKALMQSLLTGKKRLPGEDSEWYQYYLSDVAEIIVSPVDKKSYNDEIAVELCNYTDVYYNHTITSKINFMKATATRSEIEKYTLKFGDVIITKDSETPGDIAIPALVSEELNGVLCGYHLAIIRTDNENACGGYINYLFSMPKIRYYFFTLATGATRFGLSVSGIHKAFFKLPPLPEQQKIAAVLTAADNEIDLLQKKLVFLKQEKAALMQQLLTGKRRVKVEAA